MVDWMLPELTSSYDVVAHAHTSTATYAAKGSITRMWNPPLLEV